MSKIAIINSVVELLLNIIQLCQWVWPIIVEAKRVAGC